TAEGPVARVWKAPEAAPIKEIADSGEPITALAFKGDGTQLALALASGAIRVCDTASGAEVAKTEPLPLPITALALRGDGAQHAVAGPAGDIRILSLPDGKEQKAPKAHTAPARPLVYAAGDGNRPVPAPAHRTARLWAIDEAKLLQEFTGHGDAVLALA